MRVVVVALLLIVVGIALMLLAASQTEGAEFRGFGFILIGPIPVFVSDGQAVLMTALIALTVFVAVLLRALRR
ncbi:MAG: DUF131 domain-containing protein [Aigarchaeota archaeon]|nr:DUF131 domain-containing protein [Aigarchaeota archaeon]MCX8203573.1 DUF131 domain-containing protein [Nitrososphaeria archaeon]MDW8043387.1 DUF131 domain-containing protein [Nitrososphaerota archaeon]